MIEFAKEPLFPFWDEAQPLFHAHYLDVANKKIQLDPDTETYKKLANAGLLEVYTIRDAGKLVGYSLFIVQPHLHYKGSMTAYNDLIFIHPDYRGGWLAYKFIKFCVQQLLPRKPQRIMWHIKKKYNFGRIIERLGGSEFETVYSMFME